MAKKEDFSNMEHFDRVLEYNAKQSGWYIFRTIYWGIYLLFLSFLLINAPASFSTSEFIGYAILLLAVMIIIYGIVEALHHNLMRKHMSRR